MDSSLRLMVEIAGPRDDAAGSSQSDTLVAVLAGRSPYTPRVLRGLQHPLRAMRSEGGALSVYGLIWKKKVPSSISTLSERDGQVGQFERPITKHDKRIGAFSEEPIRYKERPLLPDSKLKEEYTKHQTPNTCLQGCVETYCASA